MKKNSLLLLIIIAVFGLQNCQKTTAPVSVDLTELPYKNLSEYNFFTGDLKSLSANEGVLLYEPITPLFTDYAHKSRFVWMPENVSATINDEGIIEYPNGAVLIKNFFYPHDFAKAKEGQNNVETRLLVKKNDEWEAFTYVWNDDETDAKLSKVGDVKDVNWKDEQGKAMAVKYIVPNKNQCKSCHQQNTVLKPIGTKVKNLNKSLKYADGTEMNQLDKWTAIGYLEKSDYKKFTPVADWQDENAPLQARAMSYLEANCGHCHSKGGQARTTGLYLTTEETNPSHLGFCKGPVAAGKGSGGRKVSIHPGEPEKSILLFRMQSNDPGIMMPELGRVLEHKEGVALVEKWIASLEKEDCKQE
ncbi:MAG: SO2930 family diheme c-type cytochrome [Saprospiraceae bacterium]